MHAVCFIKVENGHFDRSSFLCYPLGNIIMFNEDLMYEEEL